MIDPELLRSLMMGDYAPSGVQKEEVPKKSDPKKKYAVIDLHAEILFKQKEKPKDLLKAQIQALEDHLEKSSGLRLRQIEVIHGKGDSVLLKEVHRVLKKHWTVKSFQQLNDAPSFGGSTRVVLK